MRPSRPARRVLRLDCLEDRTLPSGTPWQAFLAAVKEHLPPGWYRQLTEPDRDGHGHDRSKDHDDRGDKEDRHERRDKKDDREDRDDDRRGKQEEGPKPQPIPEPGQEPAERAGRREPLRLSESRASARAEPAPGVRDRSRAARPEDAREAVGPVVDPDRDAEADPAEDESPADEVDGTAAGPVRSVRGLTTAVDLARGDALSAAPADPPAPGAAASVGAVPLVEADPEVAAPAAEPGAAPAVAELLAAGVPFGALGLGALDDLLARLDGLGERLGLAVESGSLPAWLLAAAVAVGAGEAARRYYRRAGAADAAEAADSLSWSLSLSDR
jgi:hypothetical protein